MMLHAVLATAMMWQDTTISSTLKTVEIASGKIDTVYRTTVTLKRLTGPGMGAISW